MNSEEDQNEQEVIQTPQQLLDAIEAGEVDTDPIELNYEIKRLIYEDGVECEDFETLFHKLVEIFEDKEIVEITQVLFPGFCNWIEIMVTEGKLSAFDFAELYTFYQEILAEMDEDSCTPCNANAKLVEDIFQDEIQNRFEKEEYTVSEQIKLTSMFETHDRLAEILVGYNEKYANKDDEGKDAEDYLDMIDVEKILDPVLKSAIKDMIRESEW